MEGLYSLQFFIPNAHRYSSVAAPAVKGWDPNFLWGKPWKTGLAPDRQMPSGKELLKLPALFFILQAPHPANTLTQRGWMYLSCS